MYDTSRTKVSLGILIELNEALRQYHDSYVVAGGWGPYFITRGHFDHCGSLDIDLVLKPQVLTRYETISNIITNMGFKSTSSPFKFKKDVSADFGIELDFLSEPEAVGNIPAKFLKVQKDLDAVTISGSSIVFSFNFEETIFGKLTDGSELSTSVRIADIVSMVGMKGYALGRPLKLEKDCYDLYAMCGFTGGSPSKSAEEFKRKSKKGFSKGEALFMDRSLNRIRDYFRSENGRGPIAVSRFYGMDERRRVDSYHRVRAFLESVQ